MSLACEVATLANGVRVLTLPMPHAETAAVAVFIASGSVHERPALSGIGHVVEHMVFKGSATRDARRINLDAERLGAEVNAHTDKDHTAFHMRGRPTDAPALLAMLADIVLAPSFPEAELAREREVLLAEYTETDDDPMATAFALFDRACWGLHPMGQPVIGTRRNIERFSRAELVGHVARQFSGANIVVGAAGRVDAAQIVSTAGAAFGAVATGTPHGVALPVYRGGEVKLRALDGSSQTHVVLGFPLPALAADDAAGEVAAAVLGEGMSSPLMERVREQRALAYYAACSADRYVPCGQFVIEASVAPERLDDLLGEVVALLRRHAERVDPQDLERARHQLEVKRLRGRERPLARIEEAALDLFVHGAVRAPGERLERLLAVDAEGVRAAFESMQRAGVSLAITGRVPRGTGERARRLVGHA